MPLPLSSFGNAAGKINTNYYFFYFRFTPIADHDVIAHGVLQEVWYDIPSTTIASLQADRRYPSNPDVVTTLQNFDPPNEFSDFLWPAPDSIFTGIHTN